MPISKRSDHVIPIHESANGMVTMKLTSDAWQIASASARRRVGFDSLNLDELL
jgi:hypothetical protein